MTFGHRHYNSVRRPFNSCPQCAKYGSFLLLVAKKSNNGDVYKSILSKQFFNTFYTYNIHPQTNTPLVRQFLCLQNRPSDLAQHRKQDSDSLCVCVCVCVCANTLWAISGPSPLRWKRGWEREGEKDGRGGGGGWGAQEGRKQVCWQTKKMISSLLLLILKSVKTL